MKHLTWLVVIAAINLGCSAITDVGRPLTVTVTASKTTAAVGESIDFRADATGRSLFGIEVDFGDGIAEAQSTFGAQSATARFSHAYDEAGVYEVAAFAVEQSGASVVRSIDITINAGSGSD
jgi:hypothetical protein